MVGNIFVQIKYAYTGTPASRYTFYANIIPSTKHVNPSGTPNHCINSELQISQQAVQYKKKI